MFNYYFVIYLQVGGNLVKWRLLLPENLKIIFCGTQ
jgi:hypothetical protein